MSRLWRSIVAQQRIELMFHQAVGVFGLRLQDHPVDDVDDADAKVGPVVAQQGHCGDCLQGRQNIVALEIHRELRVVSMTCSALELTHENPGHCRRLRTST